MLPLPALMASSLSLHQLTFTNVLAGLYAWQFADSSLRRSCPSEVQAGVEDRYQNNDSFTISKTNVEKRQFYLYSFSAQILYMEKEWFIRLVRHCHSLYKLQVHGIRSKRDVLNRLFPCPSSGATTPFHTLWFSDPMKQDHSQQGPRIIL